MTDLIEFRPAPRPIWVLFGDADGVTFALMPGWATVEGDSGFRWAGLTWQNLHNFEVETLDADTHTLLGMWDSATRPAPTLDEVLAALRTQRNGTNEEELESAENDYRMLFPQPAA
ncbi:hypothetical protein [Streptomyces cyaneofuscatus]|uniref:hypothetical protein n=1 Tax=Streptomyces cyaneofuscatus TaxID=66883 RepID=UPI003650A5DB